VTADPARDGGVDRAIADVEEQFRQIFAGAQAGLREHAVRIHPHLQPAGYKVVDLLVRSGPLHAGEVAELLAADKSMISRTVKQLEELQLVTRRLDPHDGRAWFLEVSPETRRRVEKLAATDQQVLYERMRGWTTGQVLQLAELLAKLNETFPVPSSRHRSASPTLDLSEMPSGSS